jgi:hypothetical protein
MVGQLIPRVGFKAKVKEWNDFKNAIEIYESDPEMNPINELQVPLSPSSLCSEVDDICVCMPKVVLHCAYHVCAHATAIVT